MSPTQRQQSTRGPFPRRGHTRGGATHLSGPSNSPTSLLIRSWNYLFRSYCGARGCQMLARYYISITLRTGCCVPKKEDSPDTGGNDVLGRIVGLCHMMKDPVRDTAGVWREDAYRFCGFLSVLGPWTQAFLVLQIMKTGILSVPTSRTPASPQFITLGSAPSPQLPPTPTHTVYPLA